MIAFDDALQLNDYQIMNLTVADIEKVFDSARKHYKNEHPDKYDRFVEQFWNAVNRVRSNPDRITLQKIVNDLEAYKRRLGAQYARSKNVFLSLRYNEIEADIRYLVDNYNLSRSTKPYFFKDLVDLHKNT